MRLQRDPRGGQIDPPDAEGVEIPTDFAAARECRHGNGVAILHQVLRDLVGNQFRTGVLRQSVVRKEDSGHGWLAVSTWPPLQVACRRRVGGGGSRNGKGRLPCRRRPSYVSRGGPLL